jgi:DNA-binding IscR family transcriptional regulator
MCRVGHAWQRVNRAIRRALYDISLAQLAGLDSGSLAVPDINAELRGRTPNRV